MIEGTFDVAIETPKYHKRGTLALKSDNESIAAQLDVSGLGSFAFSGTCADKDFSLTGCADVGSLGRVEYQATGNVWGNSVTLNAETSIGKVEIFGTRLSQSTGGFKSSHEYMMQASTGEFSADDNTMYSGLYADGG